MAARNLVELRAAVREEAGDSSVTPVKLTSNDLVDRWILEGFDELSKLKSYKKYHDYTPVSGSYQYDTPADLIYLDLAASIIDSAGNVVGETYAVLESSIGKVSFPNLGRYTGATTIRIHYGARHDYPETATASTTLPVHLEAAIIEYGAFKAVGWLADQLAMSGAKVKFTRGRYSEDNSVAMKALRDNAKPRYENFRRLAGANVPGLAETSGSGVPGEPLSPLTTGASLLPHVPGGL